MGTSWDKRSIPGGQADGRGWGSFLSSLMGRIICVCLCELSEWGHGWTLELGGRMKNWHCKRGWDHRKVGGLSLEQYPHSSHMKSQTPYHGPSFLPTSPIGFLTLSPSLTVVQPPWSPSQTYPTLPCLGTFVLTAPFSEGTSKPLKLKCSPF